MIRADLHDLAAAPADVDDGQLADDRAAQGHADQGQLGFLARIEHEQGHVRGQAHFLDRRRAITRPAHRLGPDEGDRPGAQPARRFGVADKGRHELAALRRPERAGRIDPITETQEDRLVDERLDPPAADDRDQQVDRVRANVDRGDDLGARGQGRLGDRPARPWAGDRDRLSRWRRRDRAGRVEETSAVVAGGCWPAPAWCSAMGPA